MDAFSIGICLILFFTVLLTVFAVARLSSASHPNGDAQHKEAKEDDDDARHKELTSALVELLVVSIILFVAGIAFFR